ncbi:DUF3137 domain-containing protein [Flammeovirgaceae bacterium SG7u.111]|nr:DUF3137 domain-containing protein [Flammeovirgaceae bacterium SG7u.132]WPO37111.1 DUF3137 domain-containing protein [Flammeovirgaceae bacterium SG7u.111]
MKSFEEFRQHLADSMGEQLEGLEERRLQMKSRKNWLGGILVSIITVSWSIAYLGYMPNWAILIVIALATPVIIIIYKKYYFDHDIPANFKDTVVRGLIEFVDPSLTYSPEDYVPYDDFQASKLFLLRPDIYYGDDFIEGMVDGIPVSFSELHVASEIKGKDPSKKGKIKKMFDGFFVVADIPFTLKGDVYIMQNKLYKNMGHAGTLIQKHNFYRGKYVRPDNIDFRENFVVYADDLLEGELILTEPFMQKMLKLKRYSKAKVYISIIGNKLYVAVNLDREIFKIKMFQPLNRLGYLKSFYNDLYYMLTLIDDLNFDAFLEGASEQEAMDDFGRPEEGDPNLSDDPDLSDLFN